MPSTKNGITPKKNHATINKQNAIETYFSFRKSTNNPAENTKYNKRRAHAKFCAKKK